MWGNVSHPRHGREGPSSTTGSGETPEEGGAGAHVQHPNFSEELTEDWPRCGRSWSSSGSGRVWLPCPTRREAVAGLADPIASVPHSSSARREQTTQRPTFPWGGTEPAEPPRISGQADQRGQLLPEDTVWSLGAVPALSDA